MNYESPFCGSLKKHRIVRYFPPIRVQCVICKKEDTEDKFIKKG